MARLGDLAQAWPLTVALRSFSRVTLVVNSGLAPLAKMMADEVIPLDLKQLFETGSPSITSISSIHHQLSSGASDLVINLNFHPAVAAVAEAIPARRRLGHRWKDVIAGKPSDSVTEELFRTSTGNRSSGRSLCDIWADYAGIRLPQIPALQPSVEALSKADDLLACAGLQPGQPFTALIAGAGLSGRILPVEVWGYAARSAARLSPVVLVGISVEAPIGKAIAKFAEVIDLVGKTDLESLIGALARAKLVVGVDTGALHVAAALGIPTVGIYYGSMGFRQTGPYGNGHVVLAPDRPGYPLSESAMRNLPAAALPSAEAVSGLIEARLAQTPFNPPTGWGVWSSKVSETGVEWAR